MLKLYPQLKISNFSRFNVFLIIVLACCCFMVQKYPLVWTLVLVCAALLGPLLLEMLFFPLIVVCVFCGVFIPSVRKDFNGFTARLIYLKRKATIKIGCAYARFPLGRFNIYEVALAGSIVHYANSMGMLPVAVFNSLVAGAMLPLYEQACALLMHNRLSDKSDIILMHALMAREQCRAENFSSSHQSLLKGLELAASLTDKQRPEASEVLVILADVCLSLQNTDRDLGLNIGMQALTTIENSSVGTQPQEQLKLLALALNVVAKFHQLRGEKDLAQPFEERHQILTTALSTRGITV